MPPPTKTLFIAALITSLTACGGGGGGGGSASVATAFAKIDFESAPAITEAVVEAALQSGDIADLIDDDPLGASGEIGTLGKTGRYYLGKLSATPGAGPAGWFQAQIGPLTLDCEAGGTVTLSGEQNDPNTPTSGDSISMSFDNCESGAGETADGSFEFVIDSISGNLDSGEVVLSVAMVVSNLTLTDGSGTEFIDGRVNVEIDTSQPPQSSITVSGDSLTVGEDAITRTLADFITRATTNSGIAPPAYTIASSGSVMSSEFDGEITYSTPVTFEGSGDDNPYVGEFLIRGDGGASIRLIALDNVFVRLLIDEDGDGAEDHTIDTTWDAIRD